MDYVKKFLIASFILFLAGCSTFGGKSKSFEAGYREGARENIQEFATNFYGNDFPYFYWQSPIVQNVKIPAHIENGVFVPEHNEPVVIDAAQWRKGEGYPINCPKDKENKPIKKEGGEPYAFNYFNIANRDITVYPESFTCANTSAENKDSH
ncbi:MAG: hypothetical protein C4533_00055 [Candidatus Omnitrophota bacterium]|jgi:hypothetical protein|nr:MAG: hypothetical protein C4533_00055 [Candidatus Omnitrophota bacterium]